MRQRPLPRLERPQVRPAVRQLDERNLHWHPLIQDASVGCMHMENAAAPAEDSQLNALTLTAIGALACVAADMVHEAVGHGTVSWLIADPILSLSAVAIQTSYPSRSVSAAGTTANLLVGVFSLLLLRRIPVSVFWLIVSVFISGLFIGILGPGIHFSN
jgi:hypothetical protein